MMFFIGDKVRLTASMMRACKEPWKYISGEVVKTGAWNVVDVQWNGVDHPIGMRTDEIEKVVA